MLGNHPNISIRSLLLLLSSVKFSKNIMQAFGSSIMLYDRLVSIEMLTIIIIPARITSTGMFWYSLKTKQCK